MDEGVGPSLNLRRRTFSVQRSYPRGRYGWLTLSRSRAGRHQEEAYAGLGLLPEEYAVMVIIAANQEKVARAARAKPRNERSSVRV
jgi:hypothetical protein